jgi:hypothetical protein
MVISNLKRVPKHIDLRIRAHRAHHTLRASMVDTCPEFDDPRDSSHEHGGSESSDRSSGSGVARHSF